MIGDNSDDEGDDELVLCEIGRECEVFMISRLAKFLILGFKRHSDAMRDGKSGC